MYHGGKLEGDLAAPYGYNPQKIKKLGEGSFGVATLYKLEPPITKKNGEVRDYVVRKMAHQTTQARQLLVQEIRFLRVIASFTDLQDRQHVCTYLHAI